ncbi:hypothetical protein [Rufibacter tibetensis]|uniref:Uncharacterized protein n=1 Tax=Rufibacter tibetensis TaxID=512763 RepID=A0A0P0CNP9_9BACT|nr:hypothetical protein [Rufibacter tibetensis]ALI97790.1 hypothetical protein DC20_00780 [Rufibacter tibetensis]
MSQPILEGPVHLSELQINRGADALYLTGEVLARFNKGGAYLYPDFLNCLLFDSKRGRWKIYKASNLHKAELDPEVASWQFRGKTSEMNQEFLRGLLSGYVRSSFQLLDPVYPGFTDAFLKHLISGPILSITKPREQRLDLEKVLAKYKLAVLFTDEGIPTFTEVSSVGTPDVNDQDLLLTTIVLALGRLDLTFWIQHLETIESNNPIVQIFGAFRRKEYISSWDGPLATIFNLNKAQKRLEEKIKEQPFTEMHLLYALQCYYSLDMLEDGKPDWQPFLTVFYTFLNELSEVESELWWEYLEAVQDGIGCLAQLADQQGKIAASLDLAIKVEVLMQGLSGEVVGAEARLARHELVSYSWNKLDATIFQNTEILNYLSYLHSCVLTRLKYFQASRDYFKQGLATNHLWTALWSGIGLSRQVMQFCYSLMTEVASWEEIYKEPYRIMFTNLVDCYLECLREFSGALMASSIPNEPLPGYSNCFTGDPEQDAKMFLSLEREALFALTKVLEAKENNKSIEEALANVVVAIEEIS